MPRKRRGGSAARSTVSASPDSLPSDRETPLDTPSHSQTLKDDVSTARGRFKGALLNAMEYSVEDSDSSFDHTPSKRERHWNEFKISSQTKHDLNDYSSDEDESPSKNNRKHSNKKKVRKTPKNYSYVMKLFDRSVDLARFTEDTPLYPICRAWMANKPRAHAHSNKSDSKKDEAPIEDGIKLPSPEGHPVSRVPPLLPEQCTRSKYNINLNYNEEIPISKEILLRSHLNRWHAVRRKWLQQSIIYESRYSATQDILNEMDATS